MNPSVRINFSKMQALGNDFMVISTKDQNFSLPLTTIRALSHRQLGVGFDQLLLIKPPRSQDHDFFYQIFNANGQEVGQCGNGARCVAKYIYTYLKPQKILRLKTFSLGMELEILNDDEVALSLPAAKFHPTEIPLKATKIQDSYTLQLDKWGPVKFHCLNVGNPHAVLKVDSCNDTMVLEIGQALERHEAFPEGCNVSFMQCVDSKTMILRVWERGCGETLACGSAAIASACIGRKFYHMQAEIEVNLPGGKLKIHCDDPQTSIRQIGPAQEVYQGQISLAPSLE